MNLEQRVEELEKEVTLLKAKNKLQEINFTTSYSDVSKFNFKEAILISLLMIIILWRHP